MTILARDPEIIERLARLVESGEPEVRGAPARLDVGRFLSSEIYEKEKRTVLESRPVPVAFLGDLRTPGDAVTSSSPGCSRPLVAVVDHDGTRRVFRNACRHRGARLVAGAESAGLRSIVCPYHGWTYGLSGMLSHIPEEAGFQGLDKADLGLQSYPAALCGGLLWTVGDRRREQLEQSLGPVAAAMRQDGLDDMVVFARQNDRRRFNWKLGVHTFLESYHFRVAHAASVGPYYISNRMLIDRFGENLRMVLPMSSFPNALAEARSQGLGPDGYDFAPHVNVIHFVFPTTFVFRLPDHATVVSFVPRGVDETDVALAVLLPEMPATEKGRAYFTRNAELFFATAREDAMLAAGIQSGLDAAAEPFHHTGAFEVAIQWFQTAVNELVCS